MSKRETRDTHLSRRSPSPKRTDEVSSPKKSRRYGKAACERSYGSQNSKVQDFVEKDHTYHKRMQEALPLDCATEALNSKTQPEDMLTDSLDKKSIEVVGSKRSSDPIEVPRSLSYFQHDERSSSGQGARNFIHRSSDRDRQRPSDSRGGRFSDKPREAVTLPGKASGVWRHDGYYQLEHEAPRPAARKRHAFREQKLPPVVDDSEAGAHVVARPDRPEISSPKEERSGAQHLHGLEELNRQYLEPEGRNAGDDRRSGFHHSTGNNRGRERYSGRHTWVDRNQNRVVRPRVEKWKHDLFDDANRSPSRKDDDQIAKIEALLTL